MNETTRTVWKFGLDVVDLQTILVPEGAKLLTVQVQGDAPCLWALVDPNAPLVEREIRTAGTGHPIARAGDYVGTYQLSGGALVFHVFSL